MSQEDLVETGRRKALPIAIDVTVNQQQVVAAMRRHLELKG